ncbi:prealbumin-like fold domain-containing protein [Mediterraneibacter sp. 210702-DFI.3.120]|uniref:SpaA isopeptide-forming pilin-related protein n=1 Tax=Mediterraneibacter sp. 210702-DFI.3.120 TaxID=2883231 RepID=UPI001D08B0E5|nr:SpaA isopeptide-forming pilin-related protein [Mediterraneibacter sp. 210702-DFI.3.120]MCB5937055.1 prealbumin-like fold domain-containing protein [Lachnospiraceae bacterium 210521-DFI.3.107]MCB6487053.1 prealbumin-like fold domain-containing protein [Mediterraneibacter sp. 210702-DFI.3.120]
MQRNWRTEYFKNLIKDKTRTKRWRKVLLCLSCVVVFWTVYALILPAITLESKKCNIEEHTHSAECYSESQELICGKEEHVHTAECTSISNNDSSNSGEDAGTVPDTSGNDANGNEEGKNTPEESVIPEESIVPAEPETSSGTGTTETPGETGEYVLNDHTDQITSVTFTYKKDGKEVEVDKGQTIDTPDDLSMNIKVVFKSIPVATLREHNGKFVYNLPKEFQIKETTTKNMTEDSKVIGTITVDTNGKVVVAYNDEYLNGLNANSTIGGNFFAAAELKLNSVTEGNGKTTVTTPNGDITINLGTDYNEHYGTVAVTKQCSKEGGDYIKYTVTVTAGEDGIKNLYVVDQFTENKNLVNYVGIGKTTQTLNSAENHQNPYETITSSESSPAPGTIYLTNEANSGQKIPESITDTTAVTEPGSFVWNIAEMKAREIRTLTYFVKLKDTAGIINVENNQNIRNKAQLYTKGVSDKIYTKGDSENVFQPHIDYTMQKEAATPTKDAEGNYIIEYTLRFSLNEASNYPLKNFVFWDYLNYSGYTTHGDMHPYISYIPESFQVINSKNENITENMDIYWAKGNDENYKKDWDFETGGNPVRFKIMGKKGSPINVNPGETYSVTYKLKVQPEVYAVMKANSVEIKNKYLASCSNACKSDGYIGNTGRTVTLNDYQWVQKTKDNEPTSESVDISIPSDQEKYQYTSEGISKISSESSGTSESVTVPAGSWKYTVIVNKTLGQWDLTDTTMTDTLSPDYMQYVGYVKITAYEEGKEEPVRTKWLDIDEKSSFSLKPSQIGWTENLYWYKFEYYATPKNLGTISKENVTNTFKLDKARRNGQEFAFGDAVKSSQTVTITGHYNLNAQKKAWYYEKPEENATTWQNGQLYWIIEVKGSVIKKGTQIKDAVSWDKVSFIHNNGESIVGVYQGDLEGIETRYKNFVEFQQANTASKKEINELFELSYNGNRDGFDNGEHNGRFNDMFIKAKKDIELGENQNLYIIVRTEPLDLPEEYREPKRYENRLFIIDSGKSENDQREMGSAEQSLYNGGDILKELGQTFEYDRTDGTDGTVKVIEPGKDKGDINRICKNLLTSGVYAAWAFKVNYTGELQGTYRVLEEIPDGMELAYIRIKWPGDNAQDIVSKDITGLGGEWERKSNSTTTDRGQENQETIYYVNKNGKQALIELGEFKAGKIVDDYSVDVQVVCRVTDKNVLLGGEEKTFTNKVTLQNADGTKDISTATANATLSDNNLTKKNNLTNESNYTMSAASTSQRLTYTITANARGQQLLTDDGEKLTIVDKLGDNLSLVGDSFHARNLKDNTSVPINPKYNLKTKIIEIEIPDKTPVEITYSATVDVAPDTDKKVNVTNEVYWKSYSSGGGATNTINNYSYTLNAGGSTESTEHPVLTIKKTDPDDLINKLQGVKFSIYECELVKNKIQRKSDSEVTSGTTNAAGVYTVEATKLNYNTIYEVKETKTVEGYILDETPHYIMRVKKEDSRDYSDVVKQYITYCEEKNNPNQYKVAYDLQSFNLDVYNAQQGIIVKKDFINDAAGNSHNPVSGTYRFGLYNNANGEGDPLEIVSIEYSPGDAGGKTAKFKNQELNTTYYVFELDDNKRPIKASQEATINKQQYIVTYSNNAANNAAKCGDTVTVTNQSHTKMLPTTGSCGTLLYRLAGTILMLLASLRMLLRYTKK